VDPDGAVGIKTTLGGEWPQGVWEVKLRGSSQPVRVFLLKLFEQVVSS
jgi:hypothetical protein